MIAVSAAFQACWQKKQGQADDFKVFYKRNYWNGAAFVYEANWVELPAGSFELPTVVPNQLDSPLENVVSTAVLSLKVDNTYNQWVPSASSPSIFAADAVAVNGYRQYKTMIQFRFGYKRATDNAWEWANQFTGVLIRPKPTAKDGFCELMIASNSLLLEKCDGYKLGIAFTNEACIPATGDGVNLKFETTSTGVDSLKSKNGVMDNGTGKTQGLDYTVGNTNAVAGINNTGRAMVTFAVAPAAGHAITTSGIKWLQLQLCETMIGSACDQAGITAGMRNISPIIFPGGVTSYQVYNTQGQWQTFTLGAAIDTISLVNTIKMYIGDFVASPANDLTPWTVYAVSAGFMTVANGYIENNLGGTSAGDFSRAAINNYGEWDFDLRMFSPAKTGYFNAVQFITIATPGVPSAGAEIFNHGYVIEFDSNNSGTITANFQVVGAGLTSLGTWTFANDTAFHTIKVKRNFAGQFTIYMDGVLKLTATDTTYTSGCTLFAVELLTPAGSTTNSAINNIKANGVTSDTAVSPAFDMVAPTAIGAITYAGTVPVNTSVLIETQTSASNTPFNDPDGWKALGGGGQVMSAVRRYIMIRVTFSRTDVTITAAFTSLTLQFVSTTVQLGLAQFTGLTGLDVVEKLTKLPDYEMVFDSSGVLQVRPKAVVAAAAVVLTQENGIIDVLDWTTGEDDVRNAIYVTSGPYLSVYDTAQSVIDGTDSSPTSEDQYGRVPENEDYSDFLLAFEVDITQARSQAVHDRLYRKRKKIRMTIWHVPWLEISDKVNVTILDFPRRAYGNDPLMTVGPNLNLSAPENNLALALDMKVLEYKPNYQNGTAELYAEEILQ